MLVLDKYYQIIEKESFLVSYFWKGLHLLSLLSAVCFSFAAADYFQHLIIGFGYHCFINTKLVFKNRSECYNPIGEYKLNTSFHNSETDWGSQFPCQYFDFVYVLSFVSGLILLGFIIILPQGGAAITHDTYSRPWKFVFPAALITGIAVIFVLIGFLLVKGGMNHFCLNFEEQLKTPKCNVDVNIYTLIFNKHVIDVYHYMNMVEISAASALISWAVVMASFVLRLLLGIDFKLVVYHLEKGDKSSKTVNVDDELGTNSSTVSILDLEMEEKGTYITADSSIQSSSYHSPVNV